MAKKKSSHQTKQPNPPSKTVLQEPPLSMADDNSNDKISNLKSLNALLLKETVEKRQEISALIESKKSLESQLTRSESQVQSLMSELSQLKEDDVGEQVVKDVVRVFMESEIVGSMTREKEEVEEKSKCLEREMEEVVKERDEIERAKFDADLEIGSMKKMVNELRDRLADMEGRQRSLGKEFEGLKLKYEVSINVVDEKEKEIGVMRKEFEDLRGEIQGLNVKKEEILREKAGLCREIEKKDGLIKELEGVVDELKGLVSRGKAEEEKWRGKFLELEEESAIVADEVEGLKADMSRLVNENKEKETQIKSLEGEKSNIVVKLNEFEEELKKTKLVYGEIADEKIRLEEVKSIQLKEISELQNELNEVRGNVSSLQESNRGYVEKNEKLASKIDDHENALIRVCVERDALKEALDEEKRNGIELQAKVSDISSQMLETAKVIKDLRAVGDTLVAEKKEIEAKYCTLAENKEMVEKEAVIAKEKINELEVSMKAKTEMLGSALDMLRNTVSQLSANNEKKSEDEGMKVKKRGVGEMELITAELEVMRSAFKSRETKVGEMHKEMESLQSSLVEAKKKKNFWTLISSATTIFAAVVSFAYASSSRVH